MTFKQALEIVLAFEGAMSNDPNDPGGLTKYGISQKAYPDLDIAGLTREQAGLIYLRDYWNACRCDELPWPLRLPVFDAAVNQGQGTAAKILQGLVGVAKDGVIGAKTIAAARQFDSVQLAENYLAERLLVYTHAQGFERFGRGWFRRVIQLASG